MIDWPQPLLKSLFSENLTIFFGAGVTKELEFDLWSELIHRLNEEIKIPEELTSELTTSIDSKDYLNAMDIFLTAKEEETIHIINETYKHDEFKHHELVASNEALLFELGASAYLTTNIDNSLDEVLGMTGKKQTAVYSYKNQNDIKNRLISRDSRDPLVIRLHGDLQDIDSLIFSQEQYSRLNKDNNFIFEYIIPALLVSTMTLFVGYSLNDPDIQLILENTAKVRGLNLNLLLLNTDSTLSDHKKHLFTQRYGIKVIDLFTNDNDNPTDSLKVGLKELAAIRRVLADMQPGAVRELLAKGEKSRTQELMDLIYGKTSALQ